MMEATERAMKEATERAMKGATEKANVIRRQKIKVHRERDVHKNVNMSRWECEPQIWQKSWPTGNWLWWLTK